MVEEISIIPDGTIISPKGFLAGAAYAGLKTYGDNPLDLGLIYSETTAHSAGTFTTNQIVSNAVTVSRNNIMSGHSRAIIANSGCANCCVGEPGLKDAQEMTLLAAEKLDITPEEVLVCSTGMIGVELPMALIRKGVHNTSLDRTAGHSFAKAILTTDTFSKEIAVSFSIAGATVSLGGCAKGSGMIHPNMGTMLAFLTTDASISKDDLQNALFEAVDASFNMISVDGDSSTNDTVLLLANGATKTPEIKPGTSEAAIFQKALNQVCVYLAKEIARDGEGASRLFEVTIEGAESLADARIAARSVTSSNLVKSAVHGNDPNWGRIMMAIGKSGAKVEESKIALYINDVCIMENGLPIPFFKDAIVATMKGPNVRFLVNLNRGSHTATAWGCDLSEAYVVINSAYST